MIARKYEVSKPIFLAFQIRASTTRQHLNQKTAVPPSIPFHTDSLQTQSPKRPTQLHHPLLPSLSFLSLSNSSLILPSSLACWRCVSSSNLLCSVRSSLNSSSSCSCHGYSTKTWKESAEVPMTKLVREKPRVNHIFEVVESDICRKDRSLGREVQSE
jgi:hypothetical protein